jgi:XTP/dITP diphosphohydrolase
MERCRLLLEAMRGKTDRRAAFVCVLSLAVPGGPALTWEARCEGEILEEPRGENGFGYDPVFYYPPLGKSFAELSREEKNQVSHRGRALSEFVVEFAKVEKWLDRQLPVAERFPCAE